MILGTAGHIDHGKTSLVKALTGIDTDRLPEEKSRGITIDIGFASLDLGEFKLGVVDVPGHERFIRNMLAGATGIDVALLVVAADDSVMPQTREHLEILQLLGVKRGMIALTKIDLVDETTREVATLEIRDLVKGTFLEDAAIIPTSTANGIGIDELKSAIREACSSIADSTSAEWFRLPIDRAFVLQGHGTIVTGSVLSGQISVGDELEWHKGDGTSERVRVRSLNNHGKSLNEIHRGQRGAINLAGVPHEAVRRGQELATPGYLLPSRVLSVQLKALSHRIKHRLPARLHAGTAEVIGSISILNHDRVEPGQAAIAQIFLDEPVTAICGQPFVLRDSSAEHTLGGGVILQPAARKLRRRHRESLERLVNFTSEDPLVRSAAAAWYAGYHGFQPHDLARSAGISPDQCEPVVQQLIDSGMLLRLPALLHSDRVAELSERILGFLAAMHMEKPLLTNHDRAAVLAHFDDVNDRTLLEAIVDRMLKQRQLVGDARRIARADFKPKLNANQIKLKDRIVAEHLAAGFAPPEPAKGQREIFEVAAAEGYLVKINDEIYLHAEAAAKLVAKVREQLANRAAKVAEIRDWLGTTRKYAVPICEYLDRAGITVRKGDQRTLA